jgi:hypothetical protein
MEVPSRQSVRLSVRRVMGKWMTENWFKVGMLLAVFAVAYSIYRSVPPNAAPPITDKLTASSQIPILP